MVESRQYPLNKSVVVCVRRGMALFGVFFSLEDSLDEYIGGVWMACFVVAVVPDLLWSFAGQVQGVVLVRN